MTLIRRIANPISVFAAALVLLSGCAHQSPAFRAQLPGEIDSDGKAIAIIGDLQLTNWLVRFLRRRENNIEAQARLIDDLREQVDDVSALVIVGDLVYSARSSKDWAHLDSLVAPMAGSVPILPALGNHDYPCIFIEFCRKSNISDGILQRFPWFVPGQPYAVDSGDLLLLFLDSETELESQGEWLKERLDEAPEQYRAALVFFHRPAFTDSNDWGAEGDPDVLEHFVPGLEGAELPVVAFNGHIHGFEYIVQQNVHYVTTGGGGGPRGPMQEVTLLDRYDGPECPRAKDGKLLRPLNYVLLRELDDRLTIDVRGFCRADPEVQLLTTIEVPI